MPSQLHEALLLLFRNRPTLAPELLREALHRELPSYTDVRIDSADLTEIPPTEYRADLVVSLLDGAPVLGIVIEIQLSPDERKRFAWPAYVVQLRSRLELPVCLLVVTADEATARWAVKPIDLGGGNWFTPLVLGPSQVPEVTEESRAQVHPELAVLSAMTHGRDQDIGKAARIAAAAQAASLRLDEERSRLYFDLVLASLSEAVRQELQSMDPAKYEYQSEFAKRYVAQGRAEGKVEGKVEGKAEGKVEGQLEGRAELIVRQLTLRFGPLDSDARARIAAASIADLDAIGERLLVAQTLPQALGPR